MPAGGGAGCAAGCAQEFLVLLSAVATGVLSTVDEAYYVLLKQATVAVDCSAACLVSGVCVVL